MTGAATAKLAPLVAGAVLAAGGLAILFGGQRTEFEDLALGAATQSLFANLDGHPIHCKGVGDAASCLAGWEARGRRKVVLWLGNSQLHAVNQLGPGQETAAAVLGRPVRESGRDLLAFSQPNASLQEHLVLFQYLRARLPVEALVLPLVFDDLRETGLRADIAAALDDPATADALAGSRIGRDVVAEAGATGAAAPTADPGDGDLAGLANTTQESTERALNGWLRERWSLWAAREEARGRFLYTLFFLRNRLFGITAQTARPLVEGRRRQNMAALEEILAAAASTGIRVVAYVVPIRNDVAIPYLPHEYAAFKADAGALAERHGATFANLEDLVPAELWGTKDSTDLSGGQELDFMHFQAPGHELLAQAIGRLVLDGARSDP